MAHARSYYAASAGPSPRHPPLRGEAGFDVCVVGAGIAGCAAALELAERGYRVALLEAEQVGWGASGRSGGQAIFGYGTSQASFAAQVGPTVARQMWGVSVEALDWVRDRVARPAIDCDLHWGHLHVATKERQRRELLEQQDELAELYDYRSPRFLERDTVESLLATQRYCAGLLDPRSGHLHPLNCACWSWSRARAAGSRSTPAPRRATCARRSGRSWTPGEPSSSW